MGRRKTPSAYYDWRQMPEVVTSGEAAVYLRICRKAVAALADAGTLPARKVGQQWRFLRDDLRAYMESGRTGQS